ncbi:hypothetical protein NC653_000155 [Populus alba x Populus x berolinensis]|uniref:Uncharacterized protein n=1 Tax=Populus alba x Populus x berolinensis TaxID=444605 RepID=A0AAD6RIM4_9ROSI|nr:hypothetical protein NC653_000155 [Populus alba x Populus x berolinensis]
MGAFSGGFFDLHLSTFNLHSLHNRLHQQIWVHSVVALLQEQLLKLLLKASVASQHRLAQDNKHWDQFLALLGSRQFGAGLPGSGFDSTSNFDGGFATSSSTGGFASAATAGRFAGVASISGGFAALGSSGAGFAGAAACSGFDSVASGVGFGGAASGGGGFATTVDLGLLGANKVLVVFQLSLVMKEAANKELMVSLLSAVIWEELENLQNYSRR